MTVVTMREYVPIPENIYNLRIEDYEERESQQQKNSFYFSKIWKCDRVKGFGYPFVYRQNS